MLGWFTWKKQCIVLGQYAMIFPQRCKMFILTCWILGNLKLFFGDGNPYEISRGTKTLWIFFPGWNSAGKHKVSPCQGGWTFPLPSRGPVLRSLSRCTSSGQSLSWEHLRLSASDPRKLTETFWLNVFVFNCPLPLKTSQFSTARKCFCSLRMIDFYFWLDNFQCV